MLYVLCWRQTCCLLKSAQEGTFPHSGLCGHRGNTQAAHIRVLKPLLHFEYGFVAMMQLGREVRVETLLSTRHIHKKEPGSFEHMGGDPARQRSDRWILPRRQTVTLVTRTVRHNCCSAPELLAIGKLSSGWLVNR